MDTAPQRPATGRARAPAPLAPVWAPLLATLLLAGCAGIAPPRVARQPAYEDAPPIARAAAPVNRSGGVFNPDAMLALTNDSRAFRVGDVVTITLQETTQASKKAGTTFSKTADATISPLSIANGTINTNVGINAGRSFDGNSTSTQQNTLSGAITVIVQEVLPNGLLKVAGEKTLILNQGEEFVRLRGYLRAEDIDANNQVSSLRIANARIAYSGEGTLAEANQPGWLSRFFVGPWMPF